MLGAYGSAGRGKPQRLDCKLLPPRRESCDTGWTAISEPRCSGTSSLSRHPAGPTVRVWCAQQPAVALRCDPEATGFLRIAWDPCGHRRLLRDLTWLRLWVRAPGLDLYQKTQRSR